MFKRNIALAIMGAFMPTMRSVPQIPTTGHLSEVEKGEKGQKRAAPRKASGAAALKRASKKRNNIRTRGAK